MNIISGDNFDFPEDIEQPYENDNLVQKEVPQSNVPESILLSYLTSEKSLWIKASPIIKSEYFHEDYRSLIEFVQTFLNEYNRMPSKAIIYSETGIFFDVPDDVNDGAVQRYILDKLESHCQFSAFKTWVNGIPEIVKRDSKREVYDMLMKQIGEILKISINRNLGFEAHENIMERLTLIKDDDMIPTGLSYLDMVLDGGLSRPSVNLISAGSGKGKSIFMQNMAVNIAERGENVIFYTLELRPEIILKRFVAMMTNTGIGLIYDHLGTVDRLMRSRGEREGKIWIKKFPMQTTTVSDIIAHHNNLTAATGEIWNNICIDYVDLMRPVEKYKIGDLHQKDKLIIEDINNFAHDEDCKKVIWTASQQTKGAVDEKEASQSRVSGGNDKVNSADNVIVIKRSVKDMEEERIWLHMVKARSSGADGKKVPVRWNGDTQRIEDGFEELFYKENPYFSIRNRKTNERPVINSSHEEQVVSNTKRRNSASNIVNRIKEKQNG